MSRLVAMLQLSSPMIFFSKAMSYCPCFTGLAKHEAAAGTVHGPPAIIAVKEGRERERESSCWCVCVLPRSVPSAHAHHLPLYLNIFSLLKYLFLPSTLNTPSARRERERERAAATAFNFMLNFMALKREKAREWSQPMHHLSNQRERERDQPRRLTPSVCVCECVFSSKRILCVHPLVLQRICEAVAIFTPFRAIGLLKLLPWLHVVLRLVVGSLRRWWRGAEPVGRERECRECLLFLWVCAVYLVLKRKPTKNSRNGDDSLRK